MKLLSYYEIDENDKIVKNEGIETTYDYDGLNEIVNENFLMGEFLNKLNLINRFDDWKKKNGFDFP